MTQLHGDPAEPTTTIVAGQSLSAAERELLAAIPASIRDSCGKPIDPEPGNAAAFNCSYRDTVHLQYNLYASDSELRDAFAAAKARYGGAERFVSDGKASIISTDLTHDVLTFAWRDDTNQSALAEAWSVIDRAG